MRLQQGSQSTGRQGTEPHSRLSGSEWARPVCILQPLHSAHSPGSATSCQICGGITDVMCLNHPETIPPPGLWRKLFTEPVRGAKGWGPLLYRRALSALPVWGDTVGGRQGAGAVKLHPAFPHRNSPGALHQTLSPAWLCAVSVFLHVFILSHCKTYFTA